MRGYRKHLSVMALVLLLLVTAGAGPPACDSKDQPRSVADILVTAGNVKRQLRELERVAPGTGITAQQDYDISYRLLAANKAYRGFINLELARLDADPNAIPNPDARRAAIIALVTSLRSLEDPGALGIKSAKARALWTQAITGLNNVIIGLELLQGGK